MLRAGFSRALSDAFRATSMLFTPKAPLVTNLWAIKEVSLQPGGGGLGPRYIPVIRSRNPSVYDALQTYVNSLSVRSVEHWLEADYLGKYFTMRNWYMPGSLMTAAHVTKWFLRGSDTPLLVGEYMDKFWENFVPSNYRVLDFSDISCPKYEASAGITEIWNPTAKACEWTYTTKGRLWNRHQEGTRYWLEEAMKTLPTDWLDLPLVKVLDKRCWPLEGFVIEKPAIRMESGPEKCRWVRASSANQYLLGRSFIAAIQSGSWKDSIQYLGLARNAQRGAIVAETMDSKDEPYIATHGDDLIIYCPKCRRFHSMDWSNWDLRISASLLMRAYEGLYKAIGHFLSAVQKRAFYVLAYEGIRAKTIWPWNEEGEESISVRHTLGHVRSGSGEFVMLNNCINQAVTRWLFDKVHRQLEGKEYPCRSKLFWPLMSGLALSQFGMLAKPSSQLTHPHGFVACRCSHVVDDAFAPRPSVSSVVRNWVNPAYNPEEYPVGNSPIWLYVRFREVNKVLAFAKSAIRDKIMDLLVDVACDAGVEDPSGQHWTEADLSRVLGAMVKEYGMSSYLSGENGAD